MKMIQIPLMNGEKVPEFLSKAMNDVGQIVVNEKENAIIQVLPPDDFNFMPDLGQAIEICITVGSNVAISILSSWLYDKLKDRKKNYIVINGEECEISDIEIKKKLSSDENK
ncbi:hypothetical protein CSC2_29670 [Clostridium zeae]|uniref:Uncharacterized protein n=1 Tax=Clostridium zeae TaxID=2759022 RepID=A0ABQ1ECH0_9CLOT|nr:hypothetical protein [Clostridium zeae]GFZ32441.1 hypothetical protein CSC2_29670 [Clostridium zeae]